MGSSDVDLRRLLVPPGAFLLRHALPLVGRTYRLEVLGREILERTADSGQAVILSFWHDRSAILGYLLYKLHRHGMRLTLLASHSRDGELIARMGRGWGFDIVRGSASRGGGRAIIALYRAIRRAGSSPVAIPDGPRGPKHSFKRGVLTLAQMSGAPILPFSSAASDPWRLRSWDRMMIAKPFSRVVVAVGEPEAVPRELDDVGREAALRRLEQSLDRLGAAASEALTA